LDKLGLWSQAKHDILEKYASAYTTILSNQKGINRIVYIDAFAGAGVAEDRESGALISGSATRVAKVSPPFDELHFIELDRTKAFALADTMAGDPRVHVHAGDADTVLRRDVLPRCRYTDRARALCLLDPYGLSVEWELLETIGHMGSVEIFFNFMVMGANRNVLWSDPSKVSDSRRQLMDRVWGDRSWEQAAYDQTPHLFGSSPVKVSNERLVEAYRERLQKVGGFKYVPRPVPMKNTRRATVYYLFFASPNKTANKIVTSIFSKYRQRLA
jgi:three-Cys-motif partner protein